MSTPIFVDGAIVVYNAATGVVQPGLVPSLDGNSIGHALDHVTLTTPSVSGLYLISSILDLTVPAIGGGATSTLGPLTITYMCADALDLHTATMPLYKDDATAATSLTSNVTDDMLEGSRVINALAGTPIQISVGYASSGGAGDAVCSASMSSGAWSGACIELRDVTPGSLASVGGAHAEGSGSGGQATTVTVNYVPTASASHAAVVSFHAGGTFTGLTVHDNLNNALTAGPTVDNTAMFYQFPVPSGVTSYHATWTTARQSSICVQEYSGVTSVNASLSGNTATGSSALATLDVVADDFDDWCVMVLSSTSAVLTQVSGRGRQNSISNNATQLLMDAAASTKMMYSHHEKAVFIGGLPSA